MVDGTARAPVVKTTRDLAIAGFLYMHGLPLRKAARQDREFLFQFDDPPDEAHPDGRWEELHMAFANSECARYDASIRGLKKMVNREGAEAVEDARGFSNGHRSKRRRRRYNSQARNANGNGNQ